MDIDDLIALTLLPLLFGPIIFWIYILPVISVVLGIGTIREKGSLWGIFFGFIVSFTFFRMFISLIVKVSEISFDTLQYVGIFFLFLFGMMMMIPQFSFWNKVENGFEKGAIYSALLGFIWSFWVGLTKAVFADYYEPEWIGFLEIYLTLISSILPGIILVGISFILSKLYPSAYIAKIEKVLGFLTLIIAVLLIFHIFKITAREELRPKQPPPVPLRELFHLK